MNLLVLQYLTTRQARYLDKFKIQGEIFQRHVSTRLHAIIRFMC